MWCYLQLIGAIWILQKLISLALYWYHYLFAGSDVQRKYGEGCWAIVTGSTDGIGNDSFPIPQELTRQGVNICLVARDKQKAANLVDELKAMGSVSKFRVVIADFTNSMTDASIFTAIYEGVKDLDIGLLVNNVGVISVKPLQNMKIGPLLELSKKEITDMISINCYPVVLMTRRLLPLMLRRKGKSAIINVSSITTTTPLPYYSVYSSTKIFNDYFSRALAYEYRGKVDILSLRPAYVTTQMSGFDQGSGTISINMCANGCLRQLGHTEDTGGHWSHALQGFLLSVLPNELIRVPKRFLAMKEYMRVSAKRSKLH